MSVATSDLDRAAAAEENFRAVYEENFAFLSSIAANKFRVPDTEAETLAHEVFLTYLRKSETIADLRSWLIGAICHASRHYWRANRLWSASYFAASVGGAPISVLRQYIEQQNRPA